MGVTVEKRAVSKGKRTKGRVGLWLDDASLAQALRKENRKRGDASMAKTARDLLRERLAIAEVTSKGGAFQVRDGELIVGRVIDLTA